MLQKFNLKYIAPIASVVCAIHCVATPLVMVILPIISISLLITETIDWILLLLSLVFNLANLCFGFNKHKSYKALRILGIGTGLLLIAKLEHHHEKVHTHFDFFDGVMIIGALFICFASIINDKLCKSCIRCNDNCHGQKN